MGGTWQTPLSSTEDAVVSSSACHRKNSMIMTMTANFVHSPHTRSRHRNPKVASSAPPSPGAQSHHHHHHHHHHRTNSQRLPRDAPPSSGADTSNLHHRRAVLVAEMSIINQNGTFVFGGNYNGTTNDGGGGGGGRILTPKMLHATNSKSLRDLLVGHATSRDTTTITATACNSTTTAAAGTTVGNTFRSGGASTTYFTSGSTGRILPTNTWEMYQAQQQQQQQQQLPMISSALHQPHQNNRQANTNVYSASSDAALYHPPTSNGTLPHYLKTPSRNKDYAMAMASPTAQELQIPNKANTISSSSSVAALYHHPTSNGTLPHYLKTPSRKDHAMAMASVVSPYAQELQIPNKANTISSSSSVAALYHHPTSNGTLPHYLKTPSRKDNVMSTASVVSPSARELQIPNKTNTISSSSSVAALYHHPTSNGTLPHYLNTPSRKQDYAVPSVVLPSPSPPPPPTAVPSSAATVDLGYHDPNSTSSSSRRRLTFPTLNDKAPDLPFCSTTQCENVVVPAGHYHQSGHYQSSNRRRQTVPSSSNNTGAVVGKREDAIHTPRKKKEEEAMQPPLAVVPPSPTRTRSTTKGKAPDPPPSPYPSFRRCVSMPTQNSSSSSNNNNNNNNNSTLKSSSSSSSPANSSKHQQQLQQQLQLQQRRRHSLPIISEYEDNQSYCTRTNSPKKSSSSSSRVSNRPVMPSLHRKDMGVHGNAHHSSSAQEHPSTITTNEASVYHTSSSSNEHTTTTTCHQYQVGEPLRDQSHSIAFTSSDQAWILLSKLPLNSPLFVKRTSREWTYATLVSWVDDEEHPPHDHHLYDDHDGGNGENEGAGYTSLVASLHSTRNVKKVLKKDRWEKCLRLVNANMVDADGLMTTTATAAAASTTSKAVAASPTSVAAGNSSGEALYPSDASSATMMNASTPSSSNTSSSYTKLISDLCSSANTVTSVDEDTGLADNHPFVVHNQSTTRSVEDSELGDVVRNLFSEDSSNATAIDKPSPTTVGQSLTRSANLNNLHSKKVSWRLSHSLNDLANNEDDAISSKTDATPLRSGATIGSSSSPSGCSLFDNHTRSSQTSSESSPDTVNLHARHFIGSRRERMRPRGMNRSSNKPRRSRSSGSISLCDESDRAQRVWCDSTCAPESGSISDACGGSVWETLVENKSRKEKGLPTLPYYFP